MIGISDNKIPNMYVAYYFRDNDSVNRFIVKVPKNTTEQEVLNFIQKELAEYVYNLVQNQMLDTTEDYIEEMEKAWEDLCCGIYAYNRKLSAWNNWDIKYLEEDFNRYHEKMMENVAEREYKFTAYPSKDIDWKTFEP